MEYKDYYSIMGVDKKATPGDIKHAYRRLARKYHPDVSKEDKAEEKFKELQEAYEVLKDPTKRAAYDELGGNWKAGQEFKPPPGWQNARAQQFTQDFSGFTEGDLGGFSDFFSNLFGGRSHFGREGHAGPKQRGKDQHAKMSVSLEEAYQGISKTLQLQVPELNAAGHMQQSIRTIKVNIPPGTLQGQQLRLAQQGSQGIGGAHAGDLYLEVDIKPHPFFTLHERDIYLTVPITPWEAALGASITIPTLGGKVGLKISPGSQAGQKLRLKGRGMPSKSGPGDQYAILQIQVPPATSDEARQLYEKMAQMMPFNPRKDW